MSVVRQLKDYLDDNNTKYTTITHSLAYTAQELAEIMHVPGRQWAKSIAIEVDGKPALAVLPAHHRINLAKLKQALGAQQLEILSEQRFSSHFPGCELGAMPPFGNLFNLPVFVSRDLRDDEQIVFNAGTHRDAIRLGYADFERLVQPVVCEFSEVAAKARTV